jgi:hypothetical protein
MNNKPLPTWCEMSPPDRHKLLGELIDAMIYSGNAVMELEMMVEKFRTAGYVKSIILPEIAPHENN